MRTGWLSGRSYLRPVSAKIASVAQVWSVLRVITSTAAWPFLIVIAFGWKPVSVTDTWTSLGPAGAHPASAASATTASSFRIVRLLRILDGARLMARTRCWLVKGPSGPSGFGDCGFGDRMY